ncbi:P-loop NTPase fold protein [Aminobacterium sp. MB27-C1]|uniref:KAP family P-loop NTPase fold protein n=1 Tax=Aminobacterium sp. MB27-C1 TaxID=3070661 RepID=UPI0027DC696A|nr:P-loop NTPase fold protein [Aminobacterium sp. MB27-C1]WMI72305.1 P-loop NTPase fold protein [Aminobacterium sp. MB27-C1]
MKIAFQVDRPKKTPRDDLFGYSFFAKHFSQIINNYSEEDGLVLALYGGWGSGKTTILNYIKYYLNLDQESNKHEESIVIVDFNPWWFSGREDITRIFFKCLEDELGKRDKLKGIAQNMGKYADVITSFIEPFISEKIKVFLNKITEFIFKGRNDIPELKKEIEKELIKAKVRILVVIDDIDRLENEEIWEVFRIIKAFGDFPYITYLLALDREVAVKAIEKYALRDEKYLEKIIQVSFDIPPLNKSTLIKELEKQVKQIVKNNDEFLLDENKLRNILNRGMNCFFSVPRDVVRFCNALSVTYPAVAREVCPTDFVVIEAIRLFLPYFYNIIKNNQEKLTYSDENYYVKKNNEESFLEASIKCIQEDWQSPIRFFMMDLFPKYFTVNVAISKKKYSEMRRCCRIGVSDIFPVYFRFSLLPGDISNVKLGKLIDLPCKNPEVFKKTLLEARKEQSWEGRLKVDVIIDRLIDCVDFDITEENALAMIEIFLNIGDEINFVDGKNNLYSEDRVSFLVFSLVKHYGYLKAKRVIINGIQRGKAVYVQGSFLSLLESENTEPLLKKDIELLKYKWIKRVQKLLTCSHPKLWNILFYWRKWGSLEEVKKWCSEETANDENLLSFLKGFLMPIETSSGRFFRPQIELSFRFKDFRTYLAPSTCASRIEKLTQDRSVPPDAQLAVKQFLLKYKEYLSLSNNSA